MAYTLGDYWNAAKYTIRGLGSFSDGLATAEQIRDAEKAFGESLPESNPSSAFSFDPVAVAVAVARSSLTEKSWTDSIDRRLNESGEFRLLSSREIAMAGYSQQLEDNDRGRVDEEAVLPEGYSLMRFPNGDRQILTNDGEIIDLAPGADPWSVSVEYESERATTEPESLDNAERHGDCQSYEEIDRDDDEEELGL